MTLTQEMLTDYLLHERMFSLEMVTLLSQLQVCREEEQGALFCIKSANGNHGEGLG